MEFMKSEGIQTSIHYPPIHQFDHYSHYGVTLPITEEVAAREVTLPLHPRMLDEDVDTVVNAINRAVTITCEGESN